MGLAITLTWKIGEFCKSVNSVNLENSVNSYRWTMFMGPIEPKICLFGSWLFENILKSTHLKISGHDRPLMTDIYFSVNTLPLLCTNISCRNKQRNLVSSTGLCECVNKRWPIQCQVDRVTVEVFQSRGQPIQRSVFSILCITKLQRYYACHRKTLPRCYTR